MNNLFIKVCNLCILHKCICLSQEIQHFFHFVEFLKDLRRNSSVRMDKGSRSIAYTIIYHSQKKSPIHKDSERLLFLLEGHSTLPERQIQKMNDVYIFVLPCPNAI